MRDNDILRTLIAIVSPQVNAILGKDVPFLQSFQPTMQGVPEDIVIYINKIDSSNYGSPRISHEFQQQLFDHDPLVYNDFEQQKLYQRLSTWQINARSQQDPSDVNSLTANDIVNIVADVLNCPYTIDELWKREIGIDRITDIRILYDKNDKDQFEQVPSFDFKLNYTHSYSTTVPNADRIGCDIHRI